MSAGRFEYYGSGFVKRKGFVIFGFGNVGAPLSWGAFSLFVHWCSEIVVKVQWITKPVSGSVKELRLCRV